MINNKIREAIYLLPEEGMSLRKISRTLNVSKNTVISIIKQKGGIMNKVRKDKIKIDSGLLEALYADCEGRIQRIYVKEGRRNLIIQNLKIIPFLERQIYLQRLF